MDNKRFKVYITIFVITTVIASCFAIYFAIESSNKNPENITVGKVESVATDEVKKSETNVEIKEVEKIVEKAIIPKYDPNKMKNKPENINYVSNIMYGQAVENLNANINAEGNVKLTVYREGESKELKVNGLSGKIIDVCQGTLGDGANEAILFLTENGDVYFADNLLTATNKYQGNWVINAEKIASVSNICRILWTMSERTNNQSKARATFIGIDTNGNCYDLWYECKGVK